MYKPELRQSAECGRFDAEFRSFAANANSSDCYVLDQRYTIVLMSPGALMVDRDGERRLPSFLDGAVRTIMQRFTDEGEEAAGEFRPSPAVRVCARSLCGESGPAIGVTVSHRRAADILADIAARYYLSPRETQTLARIFEGDRLAEIALKLSITSSTVQDHIYHVMMKTQSRNRSELIARTLGWKSDEPPRGSDAGHRVLLDV